MSISLTHTTRLASAPAAHLNETADPPFAVIELDEDGLTYLAVHSPAEADALINAAVAAKRLLEDGA